MTRGAENRPEPNRLEPIWRYRDYRTNPNSATIPEPVPVIAPVTTHPAPTNLHEVHNAVEASLYHKVTEMNGRTGSWALNGWPLQYHKCKQALWAHNFMAATLEDMSHLFAELEYKRRGINQPNSFVCQALRNMGEQKLRRQAQTLARAETAGRPPINRPEDSFWVRQHIERVTPAAPERPINALGEILMVEDPARIREAEALAARPTEHGRHPADPFDPFAPRHPAEAADPRHTDEPTNPADGSAPRLVEHWGTSAAYAHRPIEHYGTYDTPMAPSPATPGTIALEDWPPAGRIPGPPPALSPHSQEIADWLHSGRVLDDLDV